MSTFLLQCRVHANGLLQQSTHLWRSGWRGGSRRYERHACKGVPSGSRCSQGDARKGIARRGRRGGCGGRPGIGARFRCIRWRRRARRDGRGSAAACLEDAPLLQCPLVCTPELTGDHLRVRAHELMVVQHCTRLKLLPWHRVATRKM